MKTWRTITGWLSERVMVTKTLMVAGLGLMTLLVMSGVASATTNYTNEFQAANGDAYGTYSSQRGIINDSVGDIWFWYDNYGSSGEWAHVDPIASVSGKTLPYFYPNVPWNYQTALVGFADNAGNLAVYWYDTYSGSVISYFESDYNPSTNAWTTTTTSVPSGLTTANPWPNWSYPGNGSWGESGAGPGGVIATIFASGPYYGVNCYDYLPSASSIAPVTLQIPSGNSPYYGVTVNSVVNSFPSLWPNWAVKLNPIKVTSLAPGSSTAASLAAEAIGGTFTGSPGHAYMFSETPTATSSDGGIYTLPASTSSSWWTAPTTANLSSVTMSSISVDWTLTLTGERTTVEWEPYNDYTNGTNAWQNSGLLPAGTHTYTISGLTAGVQYVIALVPQETQGPAWWSTVTTTATTDIAPSVTSLTLDGGASITNTSLVSASIGVASNAAPVTYYRTSPDDTNWTNWTPLSSSPPGTNGLTGQYFANSIGSTGPDWGHFNHFVGSEIDSAINYPVGAWPNGSSGSEVAQIVKNTGNNGDDWGAIWSGYVYAPVTGNYYFASPSDDGASVVVNGTPLLTVWGPHANNPLPSPSGESGGPIALTGGVWYPIVVQYFQQSGTAGITLQWEQPGQGWAVVPSADLTANHIGLDQPSSATVTDNVQLTPGTGTQNLYVEVMDLDGNVSSAAHASIYESLASTPPTVSLTLNGGSSSTTSTTVTADVTASGSGLPSEGQMNFQITPAGGASGSWSAWEPFAAVTSVTLPNTPNTYTITCQVKDANGLASAASQTIQLMASPSTVSSNLGSSVISVSGSTAITLGGATVYPVNGPGVTLSFSPSTTPSAVQISTDMVAWSPWYPYTSTLKANLPNTGNGIQNIFVRFQDSSGSNSAPYTVPILLLSQAPQITVAWANGATASTTNTMKAEITVTDPGIPASDLKLSVNGGTPTAFTGSSEAVTVTLPSSGANTITFTVTDPAGNSTSAELVGYYL